MKNAAAPTSRATAVPAPTPTPMAMLLVESADTAGAAVGDG